MHSMASLWLADLTYTQQNLASDVVPAAIGGLAEIAKLEGVDVEIFKFPDELFSALSKDQPSFIGFSNYVWNANLSLKIAAILKGHYPSLVTIMGGPNVPSSDSDLENWLRLNPQIDYAVIKEGEIGLQNLLQLLKSGFQRNSKAVIPDDSRMDGFAFLSADGTLHKGKLARFMNLEELPSPYLSGRLDPYLDGRLMPVIQTNRGCPFTCTFCTEGQHYWSKVKRKPLDILTREIRYIATKLMENNNSRKDLLIADSNFGMYEPDLEVAKEIRKIQEEFLWPTYINVATGKNKKERVIETARIVKGTMNLAGSVQSLDPKVLENIKRDNIAPESLLDMALKAAEVGTNTYSEAILALPGETKQSHFETLQKLTNANFTMIATYQMMLLPATEMNSQDTREKFGFQTRFRMVPRCYGYFEFLGGTFTVAEIEEIVIAHKDMSTEEYLDCRVLHLFITIFYNEGIFLEFNRLIAQLGGSSFDWIMQMMRDHEHTDISSFVNDFKKDTLSELWTSRDELEDRIGEIDFIKSAIDGEIGNNILYYFKAKSLTKALIPIFELAEASLISYLKSARLNSQATENLIREMFKVRYAQISGIFRLQQEYVTDLDFDGKAITVMNDLYNGKAIQIAEFEKAGRNLERFNFLMLEERTNEMANLLELFGDTDIGISRVISRIYMRQFFRMNIKATKIKEERYIPTSQFGFREV